ncbi:MAG: ABC transporter ATP-binding protein [Myxococcota bacterium]
MPRDDGERASGGLDRVRDVGGAQAPSEAPDASPARRDARVLVDVRGLRKTFTTGLLRRRTVDAVRGVSFEVRRGEIVGFLGPNGSGKTTTIKMLLGLIAPSGGTATLFGHQLGAVAARRRIGFLPENPYVFPSLTPREFVAMSGRLSGLTGRRLHQRNEEVLERTGVLYAADRQVRRLSKGMLQRSALGAAMVAEPEMLILDEPMSGLDPVGRKQVRDVIFEERDAGRTIFFSSHILADVEALCDHVVILRRGEVVVAGSMGDLLSGDVRHYEVSLADVRPDLREAIDGLGYACSVRGELTLLDVEGDPGPVLRVALDHDARIVEVVPRRETLEDLFMRQAL